MNEGDRRNPITPARGRRIVAGATVLAGFVFFILGGPTHAGQAGKAAKDTEAKTTDTKVKKDVKPVFKDVYVIQIKDHKFIPAELVVPANKKIKLRIENLDRTPEEFESYDLNREKIVSGGRKIIVFIGPLKPGTYKYFGEFNPKTAQGVIIAR